MEKLSQKTIIKDKLENEGEVSNLWAINNGIWRLSDIILHLRRDEHLEIETIYEPEKTRVCRYKLIPKQTLF